MKTTILTGMLYQVAFAERAFAERQGGGLERAAVYVLGKDFRHALEKAEKAFPDDSVIALNRVGSWSTSHPNLRVDQLVI